MSEANRRFLGGFMDAKPKRATAPEPSAPTPPPPREPGTGGRTIFDGFMGETGGGETIARGLWKWAPAGAVFMAVLAVLAVGGIRVVRGGAEAGDPSVQPETAAAPSRVVVKREQLPASPDGAPLTWGALFDHYGLPDAQIAPSVRATRPTSQMIDTLPYRDVVITEPQVILIL